MSITQEPIIHVDCTPDDEYPLRILRAYRKNCNVRWEVTGGIDSRICDLMNQHCEQRAVILDRAIKVLEQHSLNDSFDEFRQNLLVAFTHVSIENGYSHPSEKIIYDAIDKVGSIIFLWLNSIYSDNINHSSICINIIRCLGRQPYDTIDKGGIELVCRALMHDSTGVREAAVRAFESWGGLNAISALKAHIEPVGWLADYIKQVISDLLEDEKRKDADSQR